MDRKYRKGMVDLIHTEQVDGKGEKRRRKIFIWLIVVLGIVIVGYIVNPRLIKFIINIAPILAWVIVFFTVLLPFAYRIHTGRSFKDRSIRDMALMDQDIPPRVYDKSFFNVKILGNDPEEDS